MLLRTVIKQLFCLLIFYAILIDRPASLIAKETKNLSLSLQQCIELTLKNNLELLKEGLSPRIRSQKISQEEAAFDPTLTLEVSKQSTENLSPSRLAGANVSRQENLFVNVGTKKKLSSGATLELNFNNKEFRTNSTFVTVNPYYESSLGLKMTQPLLENLGSEVNEAQITIAVNNHQISTLQLKQKIIDIVSNAQKTYWDVVFYYQNLKVKELYLKQAKDLMEINLTKADVGALPKSGVEVLEAQSNVASRQAEVFAAQNELEDSIDKLKDITNLVQEEKSWQFMITPTDEPTTEVFEPDTKKCIEAATKFRPDHAVMQNELLNQKVNMCLADNQRLPTLNLIGEWGINGLGKSYGDDLEKMDNANYRNWLVGIELEIPWGNKFAKSSYLEKKLAVKQTELDIKNITQKIALEVREAIRQINTDLRRIQTTKTAQDMEEKSLIAVMEMNKAGKEGYTDHTVMEYQTQLADAKTKHLKAIIDYNKSLIDLKVKKGTLLEENGIVIEKLFPGS